MLQASDPPVDGTAGDPAQVPIDEPLPLTFPRGELPDLSQLFDPSQASPAILGTVGDLLWLVAYILIIVVGFRQKTYGVPFLAICLNLSWEFVYTILLPPPSKLTWALHFLWFLVDLVIAFQLLRYGRRHQTIPEIRRYFPWIVLASIVACGLGHFTFHDYQTHLALFPDRQGIFAAFFINVVMSGLFLLLFHERRHNLVGLSYSAAWSKMLGTGMISLANMLVYFEGKYQTYQLRFRNVESQHWVDGPTVGGHSYHPGFTFYMFGLIFLFDVIYVVLLHRRRKQLQKDASSDGAREAIA